MSRSVRSVHLVLAVLVISVVAQILVALRPAAVLPSTLDLVLVWFLILLNLAIAVAGWWTAHRVAWMIYLFLSIIGLLLIGAATPISAVLLLRELLWMTWRPAEVIRSRPRRRRKGCLRRMAGDTRPQTAHTASALSLKVRSTSYLPLVTGA